MKLAVQAWMGTKLSHWKTSAKGIRSCHSVKPTKSWLTVLIEFLKGHGSLRLGELLPARYEAAMTNCRSAWRRTPGFSVCGFPLAWEWTAVMNGWVFSKIEMFTWNPKTHHYVTWVEEWPHWFTVTCLSRVQCLLWGLLRRWRECLSCLNSAMGEVQSGAEGGEKAMANVQTMVDYFWNKWCEKRSAWTLSVY